MNGNQCACGSYAINEYSHGRVKGVNSDMCDVCYWRKRADQRDRLLEALRNLTAMVRGECPSLLNEDSGGNGNLSVEIDDLFIEIEATK